VSRIGGGFDFFSNSADPLTDFVNGIIDGGTGALCWSAWS